MKEAIEVTRAYQNGAWILPEVLFKSLDVVIQQTERVEELENKVDSAMDDAFHINGKNIELEQQNKRYRKDLCSVNEELITLLELDTLTDDDKRDCLESALKIIEEALEGEEK